MGVEGEESDLIFCWEKPFSHLRGFMKFLENNCLEVNATKRHNMLISNFPVPNHDICCQFCLFMASAGTVCL